MRMWITKSHKKKFFLIYLDIFKTKNFFVILKTANNNCPESMALGMESRDISAGQLSASVNYGTVDKARLNVDEGGWDGEPDEYIKVWFGGPVTVTGIAVQGKYGTREEYVKKYRVQGVEYNNHGTPTTVEITKNGAGRMVIFKEKIIIIIRYYHVYEQ